MDPADELVDVIDDDGHAVGVVTRREMRAHRLLHRSTAVLVFNQAGELFIHLRTAAKDVFPSHWDVAVGGVLAAGEGFDEGARREVQEELGVTGEPEPLFTFHYVGAETEARAQVYRLTHDGPFRLQPEEIVRGEFVSVADALNRGSREPFCPDGLGVLREYLRRYRS